MRDNDLRDKQGKPQDDPECVNLREAIRDDLKTAFALNPNLENINRPAWDPGSGQEAEADLAKANREGPEIKEAVSAAHPVAAAEPASATGERAGTTAAQPATATAQPAIATAQSATVTAQSATVTAQPATATAQPATATAQPATAVQPPGISARYEPLNRAGDTASSELREVLDTISKLVANEAASEQPAAANPGAARARDVPVGLDSSGAPHFSGAYFARSQILEWLGDLHHWPVSDDQRQVIDQRLRSLLDVLAVEERSGITTLRDREK